MAEQKNVPMIGFLSSRSPADSARELVALHEGLRDQAFNEGQNLAIEYRWANGDYDLLPQMAADLVARKVRLILTAGAEPAALAAKQATSATALPLVFMINGDPVRLGLVDSIKRPGGNATGVSMGSALIVPKRLELLREFAPSGRLFGFLVNPTAPGTASAMKDAEAAARSLGLQLTIIEASTDQDLDGEFAGLPGKHVAALSVNFDGFFGTRRERITALALKHRIPAVYPNRSYAEVGGLVSYGVDIPEGYRWGGRYVGRILSGQNPAELPVIEPTKLELVINLKTAKALGLTVPPLLLARADEVIE